MHLGGNMLKNVIHEKFVQIWYETGNKTLAFKESNVNWSKWKDETVYNKAYQLSKRPEIANRLEELQQDALKAHGITMKSLLNELEEARLLAVEAKQPNAAVSATMGKAKLVGLDKGVADVIINNNIRTTLDDFYASDS